MVGLRDVTRAVINQVEDVSGCSVVVSEDALKLLAASRIARGESRIHTISFNPAVVREPDYLICYHCGFILRLFAVPAAERVDLASTAEGRQIVHRLLNAPDGPGKKMKLPPETIEVLRDQLGLTADGTINPGLQKKVIDFVLRVQGIKEPVASEKVYDFAPVRKIGAELAVKKWQPAP